MSTNIEWTQMPGYKGETWNLVTGCQKVSPGCEQCYAIPMSRRLEAMGVDKYAGTTKKTTNGSQWTNKVFWHESELLRPQSWKSPRMIFVNSMGDLFHEDVPDHFLLKVFGMMFIYHQHKYLVLTKRPERMHKFFRSHKEFLAGIPSHIWIGVTAENQEQADKRIPTLIQCPGQVKFISCEPLLGAIDFEAIPIPMLEGRDPEGNVTFRKINYINWVICGGESGHHARPMHPDWARSMRDQCVSVGVPFFFKQWGEWWPNSQRLSDGYHDMDVLDHIKFWDGDPSSYYPNMDQYDLDLKRWEYWRSKNSADIGSQDFIKYGKKYSGDFLDGAQHHEWPKVDGSFVMDSIPEDFFYQKGGDK